MNKMITVKTVFPHTNFDNKHSVVVTEQEIETNERGTQNAFLLTAFHEPWAIREIPIPEIGDHEILVKNKAIGLNPIDWKAKKYQFGVYNFPWINGRESSGVVVKSGSNVIDHEPGQEVIVSSTSYRDNRTSTFQEYTVIDSRLAWKKPSTLTHEEGATLGVGLATAGVILFESFGFPTELNNADITNSNILVWGGSTVVGIYLTQLASILGLNVYVIAGKNHHEYLSMMGAKKVIDRNLAYAEIMRNLPENIHFGVDCVSKETSFSLLNILSYNKAVIGQFSGIVSVPKDNIPPNVLIKEVVIKKFHEDVNFGRRIVAFTENLLHSGILKPAKIKSYSGGLEQLNNGLRDLEILGAHGEKFVVSL